MVGPGPPRFVAVGEELTLAPRNPDPHGHYKWHLIDAPDRASLTVDDAAVIELAFDRPGTYRFELQAPDATHVQTVRVYPSERHTTRVELPFADLPKPLDEIESISVVGPFNEQVAGRTRPVRKDDRFVADLELPPGTHPYGFCLNDDFAQQVHGSVTVPGPGRPRCRLDGEIRDEMVVVTATPTAGPGTDADDADLDVDILIDDRDWIPESAVDRRDRELHIPVESVPETLRVHAVAIGHRRSVADTITIRNSENGLTVDRPNDPPEWATSPTVYEIFVRSFCGDTLPTTFAEIERRVPYLQSMAVDCLWLTPVLASPTDHGYHITDYFSMASDLGDKKAFESLVDRCHAAGIRVVFDLVINHTSRDHPTYQLHAAGVDNYADHYNRVPKSWDGTGVDWAGETAPEFYFNWQRIPNLNYSSLDVRRWMLDVVDEWAAVVDGFRCDVAWGVPHSFWKEVNERVPDDFLLLDETIPRDPHYHEAEFQMHYDTALYGTLREIGRGDTPATKIFDALDDAVWQGFPESAVHLRYIENHDEPRYLDECDEASLRAAVAATVTLPGAPMIYYGQERGLAEKRGPMKWHDGDASLTTFHRSLAWLRREQPALTNGAVDPLDVDVAPRQSTTSAAEVPDDSDMAVSVDSATGNDTAVTGDDTATVADDQPVTADQSVADNQPVAVDQSAAPADSADRVVAYARDTGDQRLVVVLNFADELQAVRLPEPVESTDLVTGNPLRRRYGPAADDEMYLLVDDVVVCRARE